MNCYLKLCTEFYDIDKPQAPNDALTFYLDYARRANGLIVEPMCGSGRFLIPLLARGYDVVGTDASPQMLAACRARLSEQDLMPRADIRQQYLHELDIFPRQDAALVLIPSGSFQLVTDMQQACESLRRICAILKPGGKFVFENGISKPAESSSWPWGGRWITRPSDGAKILLSWLGHYDAATSVNYNLHRYELFNDGKLLATEIEEFDLRQYSADELRTLLAQAGFEQIRMFKTYDPGCPVVGPTNEDVVVECRKPGNG